MTQPALLSLRPPLAPSGPVSDWLFHLLEPPDSDTAALWERICEGTYERPFILDRGDLRSLHFDFGAVQSEMELGRPDRLCLAYTRKMMSFLLFNRSPSRILLLGLGGGSLAKFCYRTLPNAALTAVELSSDVISLRHAFSVPPDDRRFRVIQADGAQYVATLPACKDVILADAYDANGIPPPLQCIEFYENAHRSLTRAGIFVANLTGTLRGREPYLRMVREVFGGEILTLPVTPGGNFILFAFKERRLRVLLDSFAGVARDLRRSFGLDFPRYLQRIAHAPPQAL